MSSKENDGAASIKDVPFINPEPQEQHLLPLTDADAQRSTTNVTVVVKLEPLASMQVHLENAEIAGDANAQSIIPKVKAEDGGDRAAPTQAAVAAPAKPLYTIYNAADEIEYLPERALKECLQMVTTIKTNIKKLELGSKLRKDVWLREIERLKFLQDNIVPTSGMRACTAVVTEISYHAKRAIDADVSFLSEEEWRQELTVLLDDLIDENGNVKRTTDLCGEAGVAWQKVHAVYPSIVQDQLSKMSVDQIIAHDLRIKAVLGMRKCISAPDSKTFAKKIAKYIDSKDQKRSNKKNKEKDKNLPFLSQQGSGKTKDDSDGPAFWPLIRQVSVCCDAAALSTGAVLVDLPGIADANAARNNIAKDYMKKCGCIWILAPITRAVDDKTARDLMGDAFKTQLMNGVYGDHAITFIATKCDDISCSEIIHALHLEDDPDLEAIENRIQVCKDETEEWRDKRTVAENDAKGVDQQLKQARTYLGEYEAHLQALVNGEPFELPLTANLTKEGDSSGRGKKRKNTHGEKHDVDDLEDGDDLAFSDSECEKRSDPESNAESFCSSDSESDSESEEKDDDEPQEEAMVEDLQSKVADAKESIKASKQQLLELRKQRREAMDMLAMLKKRQLKAQREKNAFCSLKRSEFSRDVLKEDFRQGLKDLDDAAAEQREPDSFDPTVDIRNYQAIDLPVFTCSSRDYVRLKGQVEGDGDPSCFSEVADTGIPELQKWCHQLTLGPREHAACDFLVNLKTIATSVRTYMQGIGDVTVSEREALRKKWETGVGVHLEKDFKAVIDDCVRELKDRFRDELDEKCLVGAAIAASTAVETSDTFAASMHWATYRAALRRHGSYRQDLNVELTNPFTRNIASAWSKVFEADLFASFEQATMAAINKLFADVEQSAPAGLKERTGSRSKLCLDEAHVALAKTLDVVRKAMKRQQKGMSRSLAPHVQDQLLEGYNRAKEERGPGSVARQKALFHDYVENIKDEVFDHGAEVLLGQLSTAADSVGRALKKELEAVAKKIEVSIAVLWEGPRGDPSQVKAQKVVVPTMTEILKQVQLWQQAQELNRDELA
ncbi:uncharacterized protein LAESUDRAFT_719309 [Laetiporus sulphureus 93-53]|uniref:Nuclear GTPase SLIP-GC n=1 Tax=Laetiporus sulphureus 93-53 TaxID=1314785 RepID=A0A165IFH4_9APHY|nr:uncharacterized protein LAESUDRAFT_719309 [Laetiporus sulphureus 93-53]KZT13003.1 hypothetical protein LAESUDRAFT_719309 [Laetiporus sulphureus 93-53]